jgi:hypothetical protein
MIVLIGGPLGVFRGSLMRRRRNGWYMGPHTGQVSKRFFAPRAAHVLVRYADFTCAAVPPLGPPPIGKQFGGLAEVGTPGRKQRHQQDGYPKQT